MSKTKSTQPQFAAQGMATVLTLAAGWCSAVLLISVTGVLIAQGHDGLAYTLGLLAASAIWALVAVPMMSAAPAALGIPAFLAYRSANVTTGRIASAILLAALAVLLAAEISATQAVLRFVGLGQLALAIAVGVAATGCVFAAKPTVQPPATLSAALFVAMIAVVLAALVALAHQDGAGALISIPTMSNITGLEQGLLEKRLADPATYKPHAVPFLRTDAVNFICLVVCLALGLAMLASPRLDVTSSQPATASRLAARAVLALTILVVLLPPLAAAAKRALLSLISGGLRPPALPEWFAKDIASGGIQLCGTSHSDSAALAKACGKGVGPQGFMRWNDLNISTDAMLSVALNHASPSAAPLKLAIALIALAATLWTARRIGRLAFETAPSLTRAAAAPLGCVVAVLCAAGLIALAKPVDALTLLTWAASLAAAGVAPAVLAAVLNSRPSAFAVNVAMIIGAIVTLGLTLAVRYAPIDIFAWSGMAQSASPNVVRKLANLQDAWAAAAEGPGKEALRGQAERLARDSLNWSGIKPLSVGVFGIVIGLVLALTGSLAATLLRREKLPPQTPRESS